MAAMAALAMAGTPAGAGLRNAIPDWTLLGEGMSGYLGLNADRAGDVNGDGFADIVMLEGGGGRALLFLGSASGPEMSPAWTFEASQAQAWISAAGSAGDVNGDGFDDVLVGTHGFSNGELFEGRAWHFLGSPSGPGTTPAWTAESNRANSRFGVPVGAAGDVNGDGYDDILVGATLWSNPERNERAAFVYYGSAYGLPASASFVFETNQAGALAGRGLGAGDMDGDGFDDVLVGALSYDYDEMDEGIAFLLHASPGGLSASNVTILEVDTAGLTLFATQVASAGDVNGDGLDDVVCNQTSSDRVYLFLGPISGAVESTPDLILTPDGPPESNPSLDPSWFGVEHLSRGGDVNGDGYGDVIIGESGFGEDLGRVHVYLGSATGLITTPAEVLHGRKARSKFGFAASSAGDVNGDGLDDVVVGAPFWNALQVFGAGRVELYFGSAALAP
jgi:hypothetical protein